MDRHSGSSINHGSPMNPCSPMNRLGISPVHAQRPQSNASEGPRRSRDHRERSMSHSFSDPSLGASRGRRGAGNSQMTPSHFLPAAGK
jgi:hypothetical protein